MLVTGMDRINDVLGNSDYGLASIEDGTTELGSPTTGTAPNLAPNTTYYQDQNGTYGGGKWGYDLYTVVWTEYVTAGGHYQNTVIESLFDGSSSALCSAYAQGLVNDFGFDSLQSDETGATSADPTGGYTCGEVTAALEGNA